MLIFKAGNHIYSQVKQLQRRTLESIRSFLFGGYNRLPKPSAFLLPCREPKVHESFRLEEYKNQDIHYVTMEEEEEETKGVEANGEKEAVMGSFLNFGNIRNGHLVIQDAEEKKKKTKKKKSVVFVVPEKEEELMFCKRAEALEKKLKEIVMGEFEEEDLMDIHEFMHYYKRLTCPFYIEMVNRFFSDMFG